ncbi:MAG: hypothetical protein KIT16_09355 [Rhodospirillaceae bacterium]|nr:hypothetical protein [Rhodospirillaceae bacterium]
MPFRRLHAAALVAATAMLAAAPAGAIKLENYEKYRLDARNMRATLKSLLEVRLEGVMLGLLIANRNVVAAGGKPLFCAPERTQMGGADVMKLLDEELTNGRTAEGKPYPNDANVEDIVLIVARKRWPCPR